ncbi:MAG: hypothetical protein RL266_2819 [Bacteroidota bacterium]
MEKMGLALNGAFAVDRYLHSRNFLEEGEQVEAIGKAGEGNMNLVLRVQTNTRSVILKKSLPWVNKFPSIAAPVERIEYENLFYETVRKNKVICHFTPEVYFFDKLNHILCLEDFGPANDFTNIYQKGVDLGKQDVADMARVVSELHFNVKVGKELKPIVNRELRMLNHQHIFELPLSASNGFDLDSILPGLMSGTQKLRNDAKLKQHALDLGQVYLKAEGPSLLHGDYYPGSWLKTNNGFRMIDPEFCFTGRAEFELGVAVANMKMAQQRDSITKDLFVYYHFDSRFDGGLFSQFAGMEIIRRLIGLAQLPLDLTLKERLDLLDEAYELVNSA